MTEFQPIEFDCIDEEESGRSDDGNSFAIVAKLSSVPPKEWEENFPAHWQDARGESSLSDKFGDPELLWSSEAGNSIKVVSPLTEGSLKHCIRLIARAIEMANRLYGDLATKREKERKSDRAMVAELNKWIAEQKKVDWD